MSLEPFPQTRWSLILSAKHGETQASLEAMESLALAYWQPMYAWLRGMGRSHEDAQDDTQGFFAYLLSREFLRNLQPQGGRFRNFLLVLLRRWIKDQRLRAANQVRSAEVELQPWHDMHAVGRSPEEAFDRAWAAALVQRSMAELERRWKNRAALFAALRFTIESSLHSEKYASIAQRLGLNEGAVGKAAFDLRQQFAEQVRQEVRDTVASEQDVEEELRYLVRLMQE